MAMCTFPGCARQSVQSSKGGRCRLHVGADAPPASSLSHGDTPPPAPAWSSTKARQQTRPAEPAPAPVAPPPVVAPAAEAERIDPPVVPAPVVPLVAATSDFEIEWEEPPPDRYANRGRTTAMAQALLANRGRWAVYTRTGKTSGGHSAVAKRVREYGARLQGRSRKNPDGTWTLWVRVRPERTTTNA